MPSRNNSRKRGRSPPSENTARQQLRPARRRVSVAGFATPESSVPSNAARPAAAAAAPQPATPQPGPAQTAAPQPDPLQPGRSQPAPQLDPRQTAAPQPDRFQPATPQLDPRRTAASRLGPLRPDGSPQLNPSQTATPQSGPLQPATPQSGPLQPAVPPSSVLPTTGGQPAAPQQNSHPANRPDDISPLIAKRRAFRLSGIPNSVGIDQLRQYLNGLQELDTPDNILALSLAPSVNWLVATVTFCQEPLILAQCKAGRTTQLQLPLEPGNASITVDCDFYGVTPLYHPDKPQFE